MIVEKGVSTTFPSQYFSNHTFWIFPLQEKLKLSTTFNTLEWEFWKKTSHFYPSQSKNNNITAWSKRSKCVTNHSSSFWSLISLITPISVNQSLSAQWTWFGHKLERGSSRWLRKPRSFSRRKERTMMVGEFEECTSM